jgi:formylglycine-generating enzyme
MASGARALLAAALALSPPVCADEVGGRSMALIPAGLYTPFQRVKPTNASAPPWTNKAIGAFWMDVEPVTNAEFLDFVIAYPEWRKSRIKALFADDRYLKRWPSDLEAADAEARDAPVTDVSWFAAEAFCRARGLRLPTTDQWEYALADDGREQDAVRRRSLGWFAEPNVARLPAVGAGSANGFGLRDMVGLVWEWTLDFDAFATEDSTFVCAGAAAGANDPADYPAFMRYSMRASLKASYTADNVGFRCAGGAPSNQGWRASRRRSRRSRSEPRQLARRMSLIRSSRKATRLSRCRKRRSIISTPDG